MIRGNEAQTKTSTRYDSREVADVNKRPVLRIGYTPAQPVGACCMPNNTCQVVTSNQCQQVGGTFQGVGTTCNPNPCLPPIGACCFNDGSCEELTQSDCSGRGGSFKGVGSTCMENLCPIVLIPFVDPLPRPGIAQPISGAAGGAAHYEFTISQFQQKLHRDLPVTTVWGFNGSYPGPTIEASSNQPVTVTWINNLRDASGNLRTNHYLAVDECMRGPAQWGAAPRVVTHLHGGHVSPANDGYPESTFLPGQSATTFYPNWQPPGTIWYHDHAMGITRLNVYMGLAGFYLIRDSVETALGLPSGEDEIPLAIQDRTFRGDGSLLYPARWEEHFFGDKILVNGKVWPYLEVKRGKYRFRTLNGSGSRTYKLALSSGGLFHQIGTDAGLLAAPVPLSEVTISPGERADLIIDFASYSPNTEIFLTNSAPAPFPGTPGAGVIPNVMKFIVRNQTGHIAPLPGALRPLERLQETNAIRSRNFILRKMVDDCTGAKWAINDLIWTDITEFPVLGTTEIWSFINRSGVTHPMHMHLVLFQVLDRQLFVVTNNIVTPVGSRMPPDANEAGWKDTVRVNPNEIVRVIARFEDFVGKYPYHCHILEHEDHEMMRQFQVIPPPQFTSIHRSGANTLLAFTPARDGMHWLQYRDGFTGQSWITWSNNIPGAISNLSITHINGAMAPQRYYRVGWLP